MSREIDMYRVLNIRYSAVYRMYKADSKFRGVPKLPRKTKKLLRRYHDANATYSRRISGRVLQQMFKQSWLDECTDFQELGGMALSLPTGVKQIADDMDQRCLEEMCKAAERYTETPDPSFADIFA